MSKSLLKIQWIGWVTLTRKEIVRVLRIWSQTLLPSVVTTTLYFLIFGSFIGQRIGNVEGHSYIEFIIPGLIMMSTLTNAYSNVSSSVFGAKFQRNIDELLVSPLSPTVILSGWVSGGIIRGILVGFLVTCVSLFFSGIPMSHPFLVAATLLLTATSFSLMGFLNALFARKFDDIAIIPTFVLTPLTYLGGVFYSIHFLSPFWQTASLFNPIFYLVNLLRFGFLNHAEVAIIPAFIGLSFFTFLLWAISLQLIKRGIGIKN